MPEDAVSEGTHLPDYEQEDVRAAEALLSVLVFRLGMTWLALPTHVCKEVAEKRAIHTLPHRRGSVLLGLVNIRGEIHLCISLSQILGLEHGHDSSATMHPRAYQRLVVMERAGDRWVFLVDEIKGIHHFPPSALHVSVPVAAATSTLTRGIIDWQDKGVSYLDSELLFAALNREIL
jgi:chemotaxis-related protein WspD